MIDFISIITFIVNRAKKLFQMKLHSWMTCILVLLVIAIHQIKTEDDFVDVNDDDDDGVTVTDENTVSK